MYFRYLLLAVLLACAYGYETPDDNMEDGLACKCRGGGSGKAFPLGCPQSYVYCGPADLFYCCKAKN